jgi:hypothetical protein
MYFKMNFPDCLGNIDGKYRAEVPLKLREHILVLQKSILNWASSSADVQ